MSKVTRAAVLILLGTAAASSDGPTLVTPVAKVISLLNGLKTQVEQEGQAEAATYDTFACYCKNTGETKSGAITDGRNDIERESATIESKTADKEEKSAELVERKQKHEELTIDLEDKTLECTKAKEAYEFKSADLNKALSSLRSAIQSMIESKPEPVLLAIRESIEHSLALAGVMNLITEPNRKKVSAFLQTQAGVDPNDAVYKYHSQGIIDILEKLETEFAAEKSDLDTEWGKTNQDCIDTKESLGYRLGNNTNAMLQLDIDIGELGGEIATARENLVGYEDALKDDKLYMEDLTAVCQARAQDWDQRSAMRASELNSITEAISVLTDDVQGRDTAVNNRSLLIQRSAAPAVKPHAFLQESSAIKRHQVRGAGSEVQAAQARQAKAIALLRSEAGRLQSSVLTSVALQVKSDPFGKVKQLIQKLVERLLKESTAEAQQKGFCDEQLGKAKHDRQYRLADTKRLDADVNVLEIKKDELTEEIQVLGDDLVILRYDLGNATENRAEDRTENLNTISTAKAGLKSVRQAISILKVFYANAAKAAVLVQTHASPVDEDTQGAGFSGAYRGNQEASKGIIGILEVIASDFDRTFRVTEKSEKEAAAAFVLYDRAARADISSKETKMTLNEEDLTTTKDTIAEKMDDLQKNQNLLDDALKTLETLNPVCVDTGMSYAERVEKREAEVTALKEACTILAEGTEDSCETTPESP